MLKTSLFFLITALALGLAADLEISTLDPWLEINRIARGAVTPDFPALAGILDAFLNTVVFALCGTTLAVAGGGGLAFFFGWAPVRLFCSFIRAIHEIFWAFIFLPLVGLNPICGVLAIAIPYAGIFAKVFAEIHQESDLRPLAAMPAATGRTSRFFYGILPVIYRDIKNYISYRFECALRSSAILGFIGLPTLGYHLETAFREGRYSEAAAILYAFYLLIASLRIWARPRVILVPVVLAFFLISKEMVFSLDNVLQFFTYEILPWPMRRAGFYDGTFTLTFSWPAIWAWIQNVFLDEGLKGLWHTVALTQIALAATGLLSLAIFPWACRHFAGPATRRLTHWGLIVVRTTPEYILAYLFVQLWGPSMLPAVLAISLHNGAILSYLSTLNANLVPLRVDAPRRRADRYLFEVLPRIYGQFLAFLFYRWEVMMRESAILGILGIYTLGFYIDSAMVDEQLDKAMLLIFITALLNMAIDTASQLIRRRLKISTKLISSHAN